MDLTPTREQEAFRAELRAWLAEHPPDADLRAHHEDLAQEVVDLRQWQARLAEGRWIGVTWPEEYGGRGAGALHHFIVQE
ncbi:MAG TPA: acyl-CoA dehydrogenase family protein, partial [Acidimicrobiales bacterium]